VLGERSPYLRPSLDLSTAVDAYLDHLRVERALAPNSITSYASDLAKLAAFAEKQGVATTEGVDPVVITRFLVSLDRGGLGARSATRHLSAVRGFCRFLARERWIGGAFGMLAALCQATGATLSTRAIGALERVPGATHAATSWAG